MGLFGTTHWEPMVTSIPHVGTRALLVLVAFLFACSDGRDLRTPPPRPSSQVRLATRANASSTAEEVTQVLRTSSHAKLDCAECHAPEHGEAVAKLKVAVTRGEVRCAHCHEKQAALYAQNVHASAGAGRAAAAACADCHGDHDILPAANALSRVNKRNLPATCGGCHDQPNVAAKLGARGAAASGQYAESIHGKLLLTQGLMVAPSCTNCHGAAHQILAVSSPGSSVHKSNVAATCGICHAGIEQEFGHSVHADALRRGNDRAPTCNGCHTAHDISATGNDFRLQSDKICGSCHVKRRDRYLDTYHGRAHDLGDARVAACYDCHGAHEIRKATDPRSTVSTINRVATCQKCHRQANASFAKFMPHADHGDRDHYPGLYWSFVGMTGLLVGTFAFFGLHTLFWFVRSFGVYLSNPTRFRATKRKLRDETGAKLYVRFRPVDRFCHLLIIVSFMLLVITGMPLKFHSAPWAQYLFGVFGGARAAGRLHRFGALLTLSYFVIHLTSLIGPIRHARNEYIDVKNRFSIKKFLIFAFGPDSPMPNLQDFRDFAAHSKWFIGKGPRPRFDRFTYWEKFDYMAVFWGVTVIGLSGLVMWFPLTVTRAFPGWIINVAHVIHSDEALLAAGFIFTFHFFNNHFRPEKFPLDLVMFSGRITEEEMLHERGRQHERLAAKGQLEAMQTADEWRSWKWLFGPFGAMAVVAGLVLALAIFWSMLR
jgi:cytochrome b subunit of formate dehydrogenase